MSRAQRLKRLFGIEFNRRERCGGAVKIIASIEDPGVIGRILEHLQRSEVASPPLPLARGRPRLSPQNTFYGYYPFLGDWMD
jgi:hypothetical protein